MANFDSKEVMVNQGENGVHVSGAPLTTAVSGKVSALLVNEIDRRVVKIRPMATPIDQLSRHGDVRRAGSMKVDYYAVDVKPVQAKLRRVWTDSAVCQEGMMSVRLDTDRNAIFSATETLLMPGTGMPGAGDEPMTLYVTGVDPDKGVTVMVAARDDEEMEEVLGRLKAGQTIVRMGRAAAELDVQTPQFEALPVKRQNYCQIFKMQVEESTLHRLSNKEVGWEFSDQEEVAVIDMRQGMEKNFLFGHKGLLMDPVKRQEVYLTGGIWYQTPKTFSYTPGNLTEDKLVDLCRKAFTGNGGASRKVLVAGSGLVETLSKMRHEKILEGVSTMTRWGLEFKEIRSNFGTLYVVHSEIFDQCGHADDGFILDPEYMTKYVHQAFGAEELDLRTSGQRNTHATVITEASCLVLRHPETHMRVVGEVKLSLPAEGDIAV